MITLRGKEILGIGIVEQWKKMYNIIII